MPTPPPTPDPSKYDALVEKLAAVLQTVQPDEKAILDRVAYLLNRDKALACLIKHGLPF